jgi:simple sugar transport system permease protein
MTGTVESEERNGELTAGPPSGAPPTTGARSVAFRTMDLISRRKEASIAFVVVVLFVYFAVSTDDFLGTDNLRVIGQFTAATAILAVGQAMLLISGEIDLSLGNIYGMTPFIMWFGTEWGMPLPVAVVFGLLGAAAVGAINGILTIATGVPSFITTLGMIFFLNGFTLTISDGFPKPAPEGGFADVLGGARFTGFIWAVVITVIAHVVLASTRWGVHTVATGGNPIGAREAGVPTRRVKVGNFMFAAVLAGFAGISESIRVSSIDPQGGGPDFMFLAVASAVIGGTALAGGSGTVIGAFLGALFLGILRDGLTVKGISSFTYFMVLGLAIIASMILNSAANRLRIRMRRYA